MITYPFAFHIAVNVISFAGIVSGGAERQDSIYRALQAIKMQDRGIDYVLVHDGARPFVTNDIIENTIKAAVEYEAAIVCVKPKDTIRTVKETLDRNKLMIVQTPQGFNFDLLYKAYEFAAEKGFVGTDDASALGRLIFKPFCLQTEEKLIDGLENALQEAI